MRDLDTPDVAAAILDRLVGRQIDARDWPDPPDGVPEAAASAASLTDDDHRLNDPDVGPATDDLGSRRPTVAEATALPPADDVDPSPEASFVVPSLEPLAPAAAGAVAVSPATATSAEPSVGLSDAPADVESLALRSLLAECGAILRWLCARAEQGDLCRADIARAKTFLAMSGLPQPAGASGATANPPEPAE